jgi:hypothetical protein
MAYGLKYVGSMTTPGVEPMVKTRLKVKASTTITKGDPVNIEAGYVNLAGGTERIFGVANETVVGNAAATSQVEIIVAREGDLYLVDNDNDSTTFAATHPGTYFDTTGTTGAVQVDTSSTTTSGQLLCVEYNPKGLGVDSDTSMGLFTIAERQACL